LFGGIGAVLIVASLTGYLLGRRLSANGPSPTLANFNSRIKSWWIMVALLAAAFALGRAGVIVLFALASLAALREFITLTPTRRGDHLPLTVAFFVVLPLQYYLVWIDWYGLSALTTGSPECPLPPVPSGATLIRSVRGARTGGVRPSLAASAGPARQVTRATRTAAFTEIRKEGLICGSPFRMPAM
jgi:hypothetical protein